MTMYNPFMMNPMGGGMNNYWSPQRMQNAQPMGMYSQDAMRGAQKRDQMQGRVDNLQGRIGTLQEQYKGAGSDQQAGIQNRINTLQGRMGDIQGKMDAGGGANRMGMEYRRERRQAKNAGTYDPQAQGGQPEPAMMQGGFNPWGGMGGMGMGGMGFGGYGGWQSGGGMGGMGEMSYRMGGMPQGMFPQPQYRTQGAGQNQTGAAPQAGPTPVAPYNPTAQAPQGGGWNPAWGTPTDSFGATISPQEYNQRLATNRNELAAFNANPANRGRLPVYGQDVFRNALASGSYDTEFGNLVTSSTGNRNVYKRNGASEEDGLYYYDPGASRWNMMTGEEYAQRSPSMDWNYYNPQSSEAMARRAGATNGSNYQ